MCVFVDLMLFILAGDRAQENVNDILKTFCRENNAICISIGYRVCRIRSLYLDGLLVFLAGLCLLFVWLFSNTKSIFTRTAWLMMGLFFMFIFIVIQLINTKPNNMHPTSVMDCAAAVRWAYEYAPVFGGDRYNFGLAGHSAGAHLMTLLYAHPRYWKKTTVPRKHVKAIVAISGVYSAQAMRNDLLSRSIGKLVFNNETMDKSEWDDCFPCQVAEKYNNIRWPRVLLLTAQFDFGLRAHASQLYDILYYNQRCRDLEWITVQKLNHFSITCFWSYQHHQIATFVSNFLRQSFSVTYTY
jgi:hypothetical protein